MQEKLRLAGHLKKTLREIDEMDCDEFAIWQAWSRYHLPFDSSWEQAAMIMTMLIAPHTPRGYPLSPKDFIPVVKAPQQQSHIDDTLQALKRDLEAPK